MSASTRLAFSAVHTEGGLLPVDLLDRVRLRDGELGGLSPEDYGLAPGERLTDAIVRSWTRLNGLWQSFSARLDDAPESETTYETQTRKFWLAPLLQELGFANLESARPVVFDESEKKTYPVSHRANGVAMHLLGARVDLNRRRRPGERPAHGMLQEFLNRSDEHLWAILTNGLRLRVLRDSSSLTRQAYCEFDLEAMFRSQEYSDFALCWMVCHSSRFQGRPDPTDAPETCYLEQWSTTAKTDGTRALDQLRGGVEEAITALGSGFVANPDNAELRRRLAAGELDKDDLHRQLLRLVYRLIFLLVAESRDLLHAPDADPAAVATYKKWYSLTRIVALSRSGPGTAHGDLWKSLQVTFDALAGPGLAELGLTGLGSALWATESIADLRHAGLDNRALLDAVHSLTTVYESQGRTKRVPRAVDYRNLGSEELGSVYEALLELHPIIEDRTYRLGSAAGNERKTTGSYYTPSSLISELLDTALNPVLDEAAAKPDPEQAILALRVLDPAAGSGHFLIAAAHRIAHKLASVRSDDSEPSPDELRHALREVIGHCVYGVDINPMAVELCKVSLWMEATEPGRPLNFLDHHIVCGNSLLGATPKLLAAGLPQDAFKALEGDDKAWVTTLKKRNKAELAWREQGALDFGESSGAVLADYAEKLAHIDAMPSDDAAAVQRQADEFRAIQQSEQAARLRLEADAWCAAFVAPKTSDSPVLTDEAIRNCGRAPDKVPAEVRETVRQMAEQYGFLHLYLEFPDVFTLPKAGEQPTNPVTGWSGGFDVVLGNPPWDQIQYDPRERFAVSHPEIAEAATMAKRNKLIATLENEEPEIYRKYLTDVRNLAGLKHFIHASGRYPLGSVGRLNTAPLFVELMWRALAPRGRLGVVTPTGIATDSFTQGFFNEMVDSKSLFSLFDFENHNGIFPGVHRSYKFCLLTLCGRDIPIAHADFVFFAHRVADLHDDDRRFTLSPEDFELLNPNTRTCPVFRTKRDAEITKGIYRRVPVLVREGDPNGNPWGFKGQLMFMMNSDSGLFRTREELEVDGWELQGNHFVRGEELYLPLYEGKMIHHFDHRWATYENGEFRDVTLAEKQDPTFVAMPRYWVPLECVNAKTHGRNWNLGWRDIARSTDERTLIAAAWPAAGASDTFLQFVLDETAFGTRALAAAVLDTFVCDYGARQMVGGTHLKFHTFRQFAVLSGSSLATYSKVLSPLALELTYTAWDMSEFAVELEHHGPPFKWNEDRRTLLRAELDALMFYLYGIERSDISYILDTFPIVKRKDEANFGEYRTKRLILERFDAMGEADAAGENYFPALDPPPADPSLCHPESGRSSWA